ncbi:MAG: lysophospholipid acyltransferase family protein [Lachnospiraceae bacterium]|nr:lysophospholipid acyltransferase family protein [Lachnospiraceae bacterium]HCJ06818.1 hypothetical protein [Lachnospiraceae bacterium]
MKIKTKKITYEQLMKMPGRVHHDPVRPIKGLRWLIKALSADELKKAGFTYSFHGMERLGAEEPCLILMNHSSFIDLKIAETVLYPRPLNIICTSDGLVGKEWLMRQVGCIPTNKFVTDVQMVKDMYYALHTLGNSVLMYPEASYSFDGTTTPLPDTIGKCLKLLKVPVVMIRTHGAFLHDPLYNNLQIRKVNVHADVTYLLSKEDIGNRTVRELQKQIEEEFTFDNFREQQEKHIAVTEEFRADCLERVLYKCPHCGREDGMKGKGIYIGCSHCGVRYELTEYGYLKTTTGDAAFTHVPDWYQWQREEVKKEIVDGSYQLDAAVEIGIMQDMQAIYQVGEGRLRQDKTGFHLVGCDGKLTYDQSPKASYSLYADYYWYELGDVICIGNMEQLFYCFPKEPIPVAKARIAAEELYKIVKHR